MRFLRSAGAPISRSAPAPPALPPWRRLCAAARHRRSTARLSFRSVGVLAALLVWAASAPAQQRLDRDGYLAFVEATRGGLFITSGRELAAYESGSVERAVQDFIGRSPDARDLQRAALLHTEASAHGDATLHLGLASDLLGAIPDAEARVAWLRRWWLAVGYSYQVQLGVAGGVGAFEAALEDLPGDRDVRIAFASMLWMFGRQREEPTYLNRAYEMLIGLITETPEDPALRVRLAGVFADLGEPEDALAELDRLEARDARMGALERFAALLIRGEASISTGDFAAAESAFAQAVRRARRSPAAAAGLVAARLALRDLAGAQEAAAAALERPVTGWEPEWQYWLGPALDYQQMFQDMKDEVRGAHTGGGT